MDVEIINNEIVITVSESPVTVELQERQPIIIETGGGGGGGAVWGQISGELADQTDLTAALFGKSDKGHDHDGRYYTEAEADALLAGKSDAGHDHDGRYYTETETDGLLAGKSDAGHDHDGRYYTEAETDTLLAGKSDTGHDHDGRYYTETETDTLLAGKSDTGHDHDGRYYTEAETDGLLAGKVSKAGDTMSGDLTISHADSNKLYLKPTNGWTQGSYIEARPDSGPTTSGNILLLNGGGNTLIGGGEFSANAYGANVDNCQGTGENLYLGADNATRIYTNAGTIANRKTWTFGADGSTTLPAALTIENGGTGATTAAAARTALGLSLTRGAESPSELSIANNTSTVVWEHEFTAGLYLILCTASFGSNATGWRYLFMANSSGNGLGGTYQVRVRAVDGEKTIIGFSGIANLSSNTTYYLRAQQNSGGALTILPRIVWLKFL